MHIKGSCHCGAVHFTVNSDPQFLVECNCSVCRRYGTLWAHSRRSPNIEIHHNNQTSQYIWGDKEIAFHFCKACGCLTHWQSLTDSECAVNMRMCEPAERAQFPIRKFDGADSWKFLAEVT